MKQFQEPQWIIYNLKHIFIVFNHPAAHVNPQPLLVDVVLIAFKNVSK